MKKTLLAIAAMVAMVACNNDYVVKEAAPEAIGFDNAFVNNSTRSVSDPSFNAGNMFADFQVFGYVEGAPLFNVDNSGVRVAKDINTNIDGQVNTEWKYSGTQYWIAGANYNFNAVAPATNGGWTKADTTDATKTTLSFTNDGKTDLLYATVAQQGLVSENPEVAFTFRHTLSKVKFSFENAYNASNATIRVKGIKITDAYKTATVVLKAATETTPTAWSDQAKAAGFVLDFGMATDDQATTPDKENDEVAFAYGKTYESQNELFMIPGAGPTVVDGNKTYTVTFIVELLVSGSVVKSYEHTINAVFAPEAGMSYDLKATINAENIDPLNEQEPIVFTVTAITDWANGNTTDGDDDDSEPDHVPVN